MARGNWRSFRGPNYGPGTHDSCTTAVKCTAAAVDGDVREFRLFVGNVNTGKNAIPIHHVYSSSVDAVLV